MPENTRNMLVATGMEQLLAEGLQAMAQVVSCLVGSSPWASTMQCRTQYFDCLYDTTEALVQYEWVRSSKTATFVKL